MVLIFHSHITFERPLRYRDYEYEALWLVSTSNTVIPNLDSSLVKDLWRNGRNTPKNCIFWKYIVGGPYYTPGLDGVDFLDHEFL